MKRICFKRICSQITSIAIALLLCLNMFPAIAFAQEDGSPPVTDEAQPSLTAANESEDMTLITNEAEGVTPATTNEANLTTENSYLTDGTEWKQPNHTILLHTISGIANPSDGGTVIGGGKVLHTGFTGLIAVENPGYTFSRWTENGIEVGTNRLLMIYFITTDHNYVAEFVKQTFTIDASANPAEGGTVDGTGTVEYGDSAVLTATANPGYIFSKWTENGVDIGTDATLTVDNITANHTYVAEFTKQTFVINAIPDPADAGIAEGGGTVEYGGSITLTATANAGYTFYRWTEDGTEVGTDTTLTVENISADHTYLAVFTKDSTDPTDPTDPTGPTEPADPTDPANPKPTDKPTTNTTKTNNAKTNAASTTAKTSSNTKTAVKTGDASPIAGLLLLMAAAASVPAIILFKKKRSL